jgi:hypothetical protein
VSQAKLEAVYGNLMSTRGIPLYVRFGMWSKNERSRNFVEGGAEEGVSVYPAKVEREGIEIALEESDEPEFLGGQLVTNVRLARKEITPIFLVTGRYVGSGESFEPLIRDVRKLHEISLSDLKSRYMDAHWKGWKSG